MWLQLRWVCIPLVISADSPLGNTSQSLAATKELGLSQVKYKWTSGKPTTATGSLSVFVSQHSAKTSSIPCSTGRSSRPFAKRKPPHAPLRYEDLTGTMDSVGSFSMIFSSLSDATASPLSVCRKNSCWCTFGEGQQSSAIHLPGHISFWCAFEMPGIVKIG